jgi:16S rRNA (guanine966-N2)-methyltransferase
MVFDVLQEEVQQAHWLDLYAGSGAFGIEALSRGAAHAAFVEAAGTGIRCLRLNLENLDLQAPEALILRRRLPEFLRGPAPSHAPYDLISLDPPFAVCRTPSQLQALISGLAEAARNHWFARTARLIWEEPADAPAPIPSGFELEDERDFSTSRVRFLRRRPASRS